MEHFRDVQSWDQSSLHQSILHSKIKLGNLTSYRASPKWMPLKQIFLLFWISQSSCYSPFGSNNPSKIKILKIWEKAGSLSPRAYKQDPMVFNQYCLDFFAKVPSQGNQYRLKRSLRPSGETRQGPHPGMVMGRGETFYDLEITAGPDGSTGELGTLV